MLPKKYKHRYEALLDDNRDLSKDATEFSDMVKQLHRDTLYFSEELVAQEQYYFELTESPGIDPDLIQPLEEKLLDVAVSLSDLSKKLGVCINKISQVVSNITDNFCSLVSEGRRLEKRMKSYEREEMLSKMEDSYCRLKHQYIRYKREIMIQQEALGKLKLLGQVGMN